ncbi:MAG: hypothetical protein AVDCRST_MAG83-2127 [uncultured Arthrobacter sp.]|uniref:DUF1989 domain-containing protein n=1 Tax=uncultured Arthrobacter sp. TaxID=114050 RepID=A0A6J4I707_9MICC|nr:urea carboxylase-associated family protein [uncultured Arthrobacter sp.]CAA9243895.1 MAG: hypothetical protein AVDCRST_MAG83-2127 [uncultured Arthrobacter sp.]
MQTVEARTGSSFRVPAGASVKIVNPHGTQVADTWVLSPKTREWASMAHTRAATGRLFPKVGDHLFSNTRRPLAEFTEDTSGGIHDTLIPACDLSRYEMLGHVGHHDNCAENFTTALAEEGLADLGFVPDPFNVFMNVPWTAGGEIDFAPPVSSPGSYILLRALEDLIVIVSACPQDLVPVNGSLQETKEILVDVQGPPEPGRS